jgi:hypothetical protein
MTRPAAGWDGGRMADPPVPDEPQRTIVVRGRMSDRLGAGLHGMTLEREPGRTVIRGRADRARLEALLEALADLGLEASVRDGRD